MGWRFHKRIKLFPSIHLNISKRGLGLNIGPNGTHVNTGIPGTGLYRRDKVSDSVSDTTDIRYAPHEIIEEEDIAVKSNIPKQEKLHIPLNNTQEGSTILIQRKFAIGYNRAGRLMDQLEKAGIVGVAQGSRPREVLVRDETTLESLLNQLR